MLEALYIEAALENIYRDEQQQLRGGGAGAAPAPATDVAAANALDVELHDDDPRSPLRGGERKSPWQSFSALRDMVFQTISGSGKWSADAADEPRPALPPPQRRGASPRLSRALSEALAAGAAADVAKLGPTRTRRLLMKMESLEASLSLFLECLATRPLPHEGGSGGGGSGSSMEEELRRKLEDAHPRILHILRGGTVGDKAVVVQLIELYEGIAEALQQHEQQQQQRRRRQAGGGGGAACSAAAVGSSGSASAVGTSGSAPAALASCRPAGELLVVDDDDDDEEEEAGGAPKAAAGPPRHGHRLRRKRPAPPPEASATTPLSARRLASEGRQYAVAFGRRTSAIGAHLGHQFHERVIERVASPSRFTRQAHAARYLSGSRRRQRAPRQWEAVSWPEHRPWFCALVSIGCTATFLVQMASNEWSFQPLVCPAVGPTGLPTHDDGTPCEANLLGGPPIHVLDRLGAKNDGAIFERGEWWRLLVCTWLHSGVAHLLANVLSVLSLGVGHERAFGFWRTAILYLASGLFGTICSVVLLPGVISVGASASVFGLLGAYWADVLLNYVALSCAPRAHAPRTRARAAHRSASGARRVP